MSIAVVIDDGDVSIQTHEASNSGHVPSPVESLASAFDSITGGMSGSPRPSSGTSSSHPSAASPRSISSSQRSSSARSFPSSSAPRRSARDGGPMDYDDDDDDDDDDDAEDHDEEEEEEGESNDLYDSDCSSGSYTQGLADEFEIFDEVDAAERAMQLKFQMTAHSIHDDRIASHLKPQHQPQAVEANLDDTHVSSVTGGLERTNDSTVQGDNELEDTYAYSDPSSPRSNNVCEDGPSSSSPLLRVPNSPITVEGHHDDEVGTAAFDAHESHDDGSASKPINAAANDEEGSSRDEMMNGAGEVNDVDGASNNFGEDADTMGEEYEQDYDDHFESDDDEHAIVDDDEAMMNSSSPPSGAATDPCFVDPKMQSPLFTLDQKTKEVPSYVESSKHFPGFGMFLVNEPNLRLKDVARRLEVDPHVLARVNQALFPGLERNSILVESMQILVPHEIIRPQASSSSSAAAAAAAAGNTTSQSSNGGQGSNVPAATSVSNRSLSGPARSRQTSPGSRIVKLKKRSSTKGSNTQGGRGRGRSARPKGESVVLKADDIIAGSSRARNSVVDSSTSLSAASDGENFDTKLAKAKGKRGKAKPIPPMRKQHEIQAKQFKSTIGGMDTRIDDGGPWNKDREKKKAASNSSGSRAKNDANKNSSSRPGKVRELLYHTANARKQEAARIAWQNRQMREKIRIENLRRDRAKKKQQQARNTNHQGRRLKNPDQDHVRIKVQHHKSSGTLNLAAKNLAKDAPVGGRKPHRRRLSLNVSTNGGNSGGGESDQTAKKGSSNLLQIS